MQACPQSDNSGRVDQFLYDIIQQSAGDILPLTRFLGCNRQNPFCLHRKLSLSSCVGNIAIETVCSTWQRLAL